MHHGAAAYASTAKVTSTASPRDLEASLLLKAAAKLQAVKDNWEQARGDLSPALAYNRKLWTILSTSATKPENPLPLPIKNNIANLGLFIFQRTIDIEIEPAPEKLSILVSINSNIAAGLAGRG
ncbi:flagellar biosynthesis regulator FlaF [Phreatobacter sp.]|uniref:flagellar biosynthesis regulator FlaF n=1 Tax=Phreatobacter sp. TaxID=1966341 RepID=UPI0022C943BD|nr:flagellar biosynthesis regulator FlaF [Phreatobacter sp.]MCZ8314530.1 flagellar biosynthesis regulator FlaF [Phreatobacter sp.]